MAKEQISWHTFMHIKYGKIAQGIPIATAQPSPLQHYS